MSTYEQKWWKFLAESENYATEEQKEMIARLMGDSNVEVQNQAFEMAITLLAEYVARAEEMALFGYDEKYSRNQGLVKDLLLNFVDTNWDGASFDKLSDEQKTPENLAKYLGVSVEAVDMMNTFRSKVQSVTNVQELKEAIDYFYLVSEKLKEDGVRIDDEIFAPKFRYSDPYASVPLKELFSDAGDGYTNFELYWVKRYLSKMLEQEHPIAYHQNEDIPF
jgi:hypothetical protein